MMMIRRLYWSILILGFLFCTFEFLDHHPPLPYGSIKVKESNDCNCITTIGRESSTIQKNNETRIHSALHTAQLSECIKEITQLKHAYIASYSQKEHARVRIEDHFTTRKYRLIVAVLSARHHRQHRDAIRDTWGSSLPSDVKVLFAVGSTGCPEKEKTEWHCNDVNRPNLDYKEKKLSTELLEEGKTHRDMVLVDMVDTYRGLPKKLRLLYHHLSQKYGFEYVLKVDDDTYVSVERVLQRMVNGKVPLHGAWIGHMRCDWEVVRTGKWADPDYTARSYPCFGGGGGNVLTSDLVKWVGDNVNLLHDYQGEDVSMGIWLSAVKHQLIVDDNFHVLGCQPDMVTSPEQTPDSIRKLFRQKVKCGNECKTC